jgi:hypothetical protein
MLLIKPPQTSFPLNEGDQKQEEKSRIGDVEVKWLRLLITNKNYAKEIKIEGVLFGFRVWWQLFDKSFETHKVPIT